MKIAITGSEGFIGHALAAKLAELGHTVLRIDLLFGLDILNYEQLSKVPEFDLVFHLASRLIVPESYIIPHTYYETNVMGTLNILELCRTRSKRMILFSSYLYGQPKYQPIDELHPISPFNPYAQSKILCEELCQAYNRDFNVPVIIFRPFNIYGPDQNDHFLIPNIIRQCKTGSVHLKDPRPRRDFIYIDDVVEACVAATEYSQSGFEIFNIGFGTSSSIPEIIEKIQTILNKDIEVLYSNEIRKNEVLDTICDNSKAGSLLNWSPTVILEKGLRSIIESDNQI
jgi:nucleoside-diphosphate-sugar epimerase